MDRQYDAWNQAIGRYFFRPENAGHTVSLTVDDTALHRIGQNDVLSLHFETPKAAEDDFAAAVRREIRQRGWIFASPRVDTYPIFLGFLAIQILAVYKMQAHGAWSEHAYWGRLRELLHDTQSLSMALGLDGDRHQELWRRGLAHWVNDMQKERWGSVRLPPPKPPGDRRNHVILPKSQALLRLADLQRLPDFYRRVGFLPGEDLQGEDIQHYLQPYRSDFSLFDLHAINVFSDDERFALACVQIGDDLRSWDGGQSSGGKARLWLRLSAFHPPELHGGLTEGTARLQEILGRSRYQYGQHREFRPIRHTYYVTILDAFNEIWEERRYARPGDEILLLVRSREANHQYDQIRQFVADNATTHWYHAENVTIRSDQTMLRGLPTGWCALRFRVREELLASLPDWFADWLRCDPLQTVGGLRLNKNVWMAGAGPTLLLRDRTVKTVFINGDRYLVVEGRVSPQQAPCLNEPGLYGIWIEDRAEGKWIRIAQAEGNIAQRTTHGWKQDTDAWPWPEWVLQQLLPATADPGYIVRGPVVLGASVPCNSEPQSVERQWLELARCIRDNRFARLSVLQTSLTTQIPEHRLLQHLTSVARIRKSPLPRVTRTSPKGET